MHFNIAEFNVAAGRWPTTDPRMADFTNAIDGLNAKADVTPGFVWRMHDDVLDADPIEIAGANNLVVNMTVWRDVESLHAFTYKHRDHLDALRRRRDWFERLDLPAYVMWWIAEGEIPTVSEGLRRLTLLAEHGSTREAFTFQTIQPVPDA